MSKIFEKLNVNRIQGNLNKINKFQAGSKINRSPADQTFLLRSAIDHAKYLKKPVYLTLYDYTQCFDSLWLDDCLLSLHKLGIQTELLNVIKNLNETSNIKVKTPVGLTEEFQVKSIVQQGSVLGGTLCTASTAEIADESFEGGCQIGTCSIRSLIYVDDIAAANRAPSETYLSHDGITWFSDKKRLALNAPKCMILCVNLKKSDVVPRLKIKGYPLAEREVVTYLGDQFNKAGNNKHLIEERVKKGQCCIVNSMSLCSDVTMGLFCLPTLLILYRGLFLQVVLYNAQAWSNLSKQDLSNLQTVQLKYIKRMFHAPSSTSNSLTYLETGLLPIEQEIHIRQLTYLHHIVGLDEDDPVLMAYTEQIKYEYAPNWGNNVKTIRSNYGIKQTDEEVKSMSKRRWKRIIKGTITAHTLNKLSEEARKQKRASNILPYNEFKTQKYISNFPTPMARKLFHARLGILDIKGLRTYKYGNDLKCRLCDGGDENVDHIVNTCPSILRTNLIQNIYTNNEEEMKEVARRCLEFCNKVEEPDLSS